MIFTGFIKNEKFKLEVLSFICALIVPLLVLGPFFPDLIISTLGLWFIYHTFKNKIFFIYKNKFFLIFISFCCICILSSLLSSNILFSLKSSLFYFRIAIFALLISYLIKKKSNILNYFYLAFIITFSIVIIDSCIQYIFGTNLSGHKIQSNRISSFFADELILGSYLTRLFPLFLALFFIRSKTMIIEKFFFLIIFLLTYLVVFLSGERAIFALLNLSIFFMIIFTKKYKIEKISLLIISILLVFIIGKNNPFYFDRYIESFKNSFNYNKPIGKNYIFTPSHHSLMKTAVNMYLDKPILGHGPRLFRIKCKEPKYASGIKPCDNHPHNFYVQLLAETGTLGFAYLVGAFFYFVYLMILHIFEFFIHKRNLFTDYQICLLAGILITIWPVATNGNFFTNNLMIFYGLQFGFLFNNKKFSLK